MHIVILGIKDSGTCEFSGKEGEVLRIRAGEGEPVMEVSAKCLLSMVRYRSKLESKNGLPGAGGAATAKTPAAPDGKDGSKGGAG